MFHAGLIWHDANSVSATIYLTISKLDFFLRGSLKVIIRHVGSFGLPDTMQFLSNYTLRNGPNIPQ